MAITKAGKPETAGDKLTTKVSSLLRARNPIIILVTPEETRVKGVVAAVAASLQYGYKEWNHVQGVLDVEGKESPPGKTASHPDKVLGAIGESKKREVWVLLDFHPFWKNPLVNRALRNLAVQLPSSPGAESRSIILITPSSEVPVEFADHVVVVKWKLPDREEMVKQFDDFVDGLPDKLTIGGKQVGPHPGKYDTSTEVKEAAINAAMGLSIVQAQSTFSESIVTCKGRFDPVMIGEAKKQIIKADIPGLDYYDADPFGFDGVGGLELMKDWLRVRRHGFSEKAAAFGLKKPKGCLIVGQPGCGKSATAKAFPAAWGVPLLRLDLGAVLGGIVGQSESQLLRCLAIADAIGPCVVWLDEMEKMISPGGTGDSGVGKRQLGILLSWMEDHKGPAFVVATANDVHQLPPELLRKGRFDEIFFVDLPTRVERRAVFEVSLKKVGRQMVGIDVDAVVSASAGFSGSEVAELVPSALFLAFEEGERALRTEDFLQAIKDTVPLSLTAAESVKARREWAKTRARMASLPEVEAPVKESRRALDVDDSDGNPGVN